MKFSCEIPQDVVKLCLRNLEYEKLFEDVGMEVWKRIKLLEKMVLQQILFKDNLRNFEKIR